MNKNESGRRYSEGTLSPDKPSRARKGETICLCIILGISLLLNLYQNGFPCTYHPDEPAKALFIRTNTQNFAHPILMLQVVRLANLFAGASSDQEIVSLGRTTTALFGVLIVLLSYLISRPLLPSRYRLLTALAVALSPLLVVHAHYLKEDILLTCSCMLCLLLLMQFVTSPRKGWMVSLGVATGLAISSHYKGALLIPFYGLIPFLVPSIYKPSYYKHLGICLLIAFAVFAGVNYPAIFEGHTFLKGSLYELRHSVSGHTLKIPGPSHYFGFHLIYSLIPGMTPLLTLFSATFILHSLIRWRNTPWRHRILLLYFFIFYFVIEISPLKPWPGYVRYVIPVIPVLLYFAVQEIRIITHLIAARRMKWVPVILLLTAIGLSGYQSLQLLSHLNRDTREQADRWLEAKGLNAIKGPYTSLRPNAMPITDVDISKAGEEGVAFLVTSSFMYNRYLFGSGLKGQKKDVYETAVRYRELFRYPFVEIAPRYRTFAFSNPTIRIIDIRQQPFPGEAPEG